jgi:hypothetical protein
VSDQKEELQGLGPHRIHEMAHRKSIDRAFREALENVYGRLVTAPDAERVQVYIGDRSPYVVEQVKLMFARDGFTVEPVPPSEQHHSRFKFFVSGWKREQGGSLR